MFGPYSPTIFKNILYLFLQDFVHLNVSQPLIGQTQWFKQSEVGLHSNAANRIWKNLENKTENVLNNGLGIQTLETLKLEAF